MPIYNFYNKKTKKAFTDLMSIAEKETFLEENDHIIQTIPEKLNIGDPMRYGALKPPADFQKYVLGKVKAKTPGRTNIGENHFKIPKEI